MTDVETATITALADLDSGDLLLTEDTVGVVVADTDSGDEAEVVIYAAKILLPCAAQATSGFAALEKVYMSGGLITETASGATLCGTCLEATSAGDTTVLCKFDGMLGIVA